MFDKSKWPKSRVFSLLGVLAFGGWFFCRQGSSEGFYPPVSISPNDDLFCYGNFKQNHYSIYVVNRNGLKVREIESPVNIEPYCQEFSPDGKKILFLGYLKKSETPESYIYLMDIDGGAPIQITSGKENVLKAIFSPDGKKIFFLSSGSFGHYSPIVQSHPHDVDVYSIDVTGTDRKQLTKMKAYGLSDLGTSQDGKNLFMIKDGETRALISLPVDGGASPVTLATDVWDSNVSPDSKTAVVTEAKNEMGGFKYDLYFENLRTLQIKQLTFLHNRVFDPCFFHKRPYVLFVQDKNWPNTSSPKYQLMEINMDGSDLKTVNLPN